MKNLEELAQPVAWVIGEQEIADFNRGYETFIVRGGDINGTEEAMPLYSQECVDTLQQLIAELEAKLATPVRLPSKIEPTFEAISEVIPTANPDEYTCCVGADMWNGAVKACAKAMKSAGFKVKGDI